MKKSFNHAQTKYEAKVRPFLLKYERASEASPDEIKAIQAKYDEIEAKAWAEFVQDTVK